MTTEEFKTYIMGKSFILGLALPELGKVNMMNREEPFRDEADRDVFFDTVLYGSGDFVEEGIELPFWPGIISRCPGKIWHSELGEEGAFVEVLIKEERQNEQK